MREFVSPFDGKPLEREDAEVLATVVKAIGDPARLQMLSMLAAGPHYQNELVVGVGRLKQPAVSHHLRLMTRAGLTVREVDFPYAYFSLDRDVFTAVAEALRPDGP